MLESEREAKQMGQIFAVVSGKGGTGKTSLCAAIASCLAAEGSRVLCVDGDVGLRNLDIALGLTELETVQTVEEMQRQYDLERRGVTLRRYGDHLRMETRQEYAPYVERLLQPVQRQSLTQTAMETLAVIAYRQPATKGEVEQIRGVKCDYSIQSLLNKGLIKEVGRKEALGRPILYATTDRFLEHFGLSDIRELPPLPQGAVPLDPGLPAEGGQGA